MKKTLLPIGLAILLLAVSVSSALAQESLSITVSPKAIFLDSHGTWLTIHTNFPLSSLADSESVFLNVPVDPSSIFADDQGNLVAKFDLGQIKGYIPPTDDEMTFTLHIDGNSASDTVRVLKRDSIGSGARIYVN